MGGVDGVEVVRCRAEFRAGVRGGLRQGGGVVAEVEVDGVVDGGAGCCHAQVAQLAAGELHVFDALGRAGQGGVGGVLETQPELVAGGGERGFVGVGEVLVLFL